MISPNANDRSGGDMATGGFPQEGNTEFIGVLKSISESDVLAQFPLSFGQRSLWFIQQFDPENAAHNIVYGVHMLGDIDLGALEKSFQTVVAHNPAFRTSFSTSGGEPIQQVHAHASFKLDFSDAQDWDAETLDMQLREVMFCPFDLTKAPLLRVTVFRRTEHDHLVILAIHHIVTDMWSVALLLSQVSKNYKMYLQGEEPAFTEARASYADHVRCQEEMLAGEEGQGHFQYWQEKLSGELPVLNLVTEKIRPPYQTDRGKSTFMRIDSALRDGLKQLADAHGSNIHDICLTVFKVLLYRYTGLEDIIIGYPKFGRTRQMAKVMGYFVNPVALRSDLSGNPTFADFLQQVKTTLREASEHDDIPFLMLVEKLEPNRALSHSPIFQVMFTWQKTTRIVEQDSMTGMALGDEGAKFRLGEFHMEPISLPYRAVPFDLTLLMAEAGKELGATIEYNMALFEEATILRMMQHYRMLLEGIVRDPLQPIANIPMLTAEEEEQILIGWNPPLEEKTPALLLEQFAAQAARTPHAPALIIGEQSFSYAELDGLSDRVAGALCNEGLLPEDIVGVCTGRTAGMVIALWAVLKAGGTFLYLDPHLPAERMAYMVADSRLRYMLSEAGCLPDMGPFDHILLDLDAVLEEGTAIDAARDIQAGQLAYLIYTSGSTGTPKGVMVEHGSIALHTAAMRAHYELRASDRFLQFASLSFDAALEQVFGTLTSGACLVLRDDAIWEPLELLEKMKQYDLTILNLPPAYWHQVAQVWAQQAELPDLPLRLVIIGGDVFQLETLRLWGQTRFSDVRLLNAYGPTETTITSVMYEVPPDYLETQEGKSVPIGQTLPGRTAYILNAYSQLVPVGVPGELYIGGPCLARGYLHRPELTEERFVPDPFSKEEGARLYRTGDLVMRCSDGNIAFKGRIDQQVKVRGFRIELGEIEAALSKHPEVKDVVVLAKDSQIGKQIHAYLVPAHGAVLTIRELRVHLRKTMPEYFLPSGYAFIDALPVTSTGKVDRQALLRMEVQQAVANDVYVAPSTEIEKELAAMWQEVMGIERVGVHDDFFELGGHSLIATQLVARIRDTFQFSMPLVALFETPTVAEIAELITENLLEKGAVDELAGLLDELEGMSDEEVQQMLEDEVQD
jgi:amino acid adenylation domain-containing protein